MQALNILFGVVTLVSFVFAVYQWFLTAKKGIAEESKTKILFEKIKHTRYSIIGGCETVHLIIQRAKNEDTSKEELANIARVARGQLLLTVRELEAEEERLTNWKFGQILSTKSNKKIVREEKQQHIEKDDNSGNQSSNSLDGI